MGNKKLDFQELKELVFKLNKVTKQNKDRLFKLAKANQNLEIIEKLRDEFNFKGAKVYLNKLNESKMNEAIKQKDFITIKKLIEDETSVQNIKLYDFLENVPMSFIEFLVQNKVHLNTQDEYGNTALMLASSKNYLEITKLLVFSGANFHLKNKNGSDSLIISCDSGNIDIVEYLIDNGVNINTRNNFSATPLWISVYKNHLNIIKLLLKNNANPNISNKEGITPLLSLLSKRMNYKAEIEIEIAELLIKNNADINFQNKFGMTMLIMASRMKDIEIVKLLLDNSAEIDIKDINGMSALMSAEAEGCNEIIDLLLNYGAVKDPHTIVFGKTLNETIEEHQPKPRVISKKDIPTLVEEWFDKVDKKITTNAVAKQFVLEEIEGASLGDEISQNFSKLSGFDKIDYDGAMNEKNSFDEVDGGGSPQQVLTFECHIPLLNDENKDLLVEIRLQVVDKIMKKYSLGKYSFQNIRLSLKSLNLNSYIFIDKHKEHLIYNSNKFEQVNDIKYYNQQTQSYIQINGNSVVLILKDKTESFFEIIDRKQLLDEVIVVTEGKTDWKHLKKALKRFQQQGIYLNLNIRFEEYEKTDMGDSELVAMVRTYSKVKKSTKHIMIFDRDQVGKNGKKDVKKLFMEANIFNSHGNNVYSMFIPQINDDLDEICIEFFYKQEEVKNAWNNKKRLFYGNEFDRETQISICGKYKTNKPYPKMLDILDGDNKKKVYYFEDEKCENNIALSKNDFTNNIINDVEGFNNFDIEYFKLIFDVIEKIVND